MRGSDEVHRAAIHLPSIPMRVIGGTYRSRQLVAPRGMATRPTSDRLRETLFNILSPFIEDAVFADLYAGSGAVGIEALSRGARSVSFVDEAPAAIAAIRGNLAALDIKSGVRIEAAPVMSALKKITSANIVFLDPPYAAADEYTRTLQMIARNADSLLAPDAIVVVEHDRAAEAMLAAQYGPLERYRLLAQGDARLSFYRR